MNRPMRGEMALGAVLAFLAALTRRRGIVVGAVLGLLTLGTITAASAYWTAPGRRVRRRTGTTQAVTLSPGQPTAALFPGGEAGVTLTVTNPNTASVRVGSLSLDTSPGDGRFHRRRRALGVRRGQPVLHDSDQRRFRLDGRRRRRTVDHVGQFAFHGS